MADLGISCLTCPCYVVSGNTKNGVCHGRPPQPFIIPGPPDPLTGSPTATVRALWPPVGEMDWCARHPMFGIGMPIDNRLSEKAEGSS